LEIGLQDKMARDAGIGLWLWWVQIEITGG